MIPLHRFSWAYTIEVPIIFAAAMQAAGGGGGAQDPFASPLAQYGLLGAFVIGILYLKVIVPGWVYQAEVERGKQKDEIIKAKDEEIVRLRDLAEKQTIPLVQRAMVLIEHAEVRETAWKEQQQHGTQAGPFPGRFPGPGQEG